MTAQIIQFVPRPDPNREARLQQMAAEAFNAAFPTWPTPYTETESYTAPDKDSA